jgi:hypothetical protein
MRRIPKFTSTKAQREYWDSHDAIEILGTNGWKISKAGTTSVISLYVTKVGTRGAVVRVPREWLAAIGAKKGRSIKARVSGKRLVMELA